MFKRTTQGERKEKGREEEQSGGSLECGKSRVDAHAACVPPSSSLLLSYTRSLALPHCSRAS